MSNDDVVCAISFDPLDTARYISEVEHPGCGGIAMFAGVVRDHADGRAVIGLIYEAHPSAAQVLGDVCRRAAALPGVRRVRAVHRVGSLVVGDLAVVVVVSAPHRDEAFIACRWLIDTLKAEVPIWKQESYADGQRAWVSCP